MEIGIAEQLWRHRDSEITVSSNEMIQTSIILNWWSKKKKKTKSIDEQRNAYRFSEILPMQTLKNIKKSIQKQGIVLNELVVVGNFRGGQKPQLGINGCHFFQFCCHRALPFFSLSSIYLRIRLQISHDWIEQNDKKNLIMTLNRMLHVWTWELDWRSKRKGSFFMQIKLTRENKNA